MYWLMLKTAGKRMVRIDFNYVASALDMAERYQEDHADLVQWSVTDEHGKIFGHWLAP